MADPKSIHEFLPTSGNIGSLFLVDDPDSQATSGYTTRQISMDDVGEMVNNGIDYTQDLSTENKKVIGAINELHGVDGFDVYDETTTSANKYEQGDICIHNNTLQVCTDANGAYGAWDSTKWSPTTIKALLALKQNSTDNSLDTDDKTVVGAINELKSERTPKFIGSFVRTSNATTGKVAIPFSTLGITSKPAAVIGVQEYKNDISLNIFYAFDETNSADGVILYFQNTTNNAIEKNRLMRFGLIVFEYGDVVD